MMKPSKTGGGSRPASPDVVDYDLLTSSCSSDSGASHGSRSTLDGSGSRSHGNVKTTAQRRIRPSDMKALEKLRASGDGSSSSTNPFAALLGRSKSTKVSGAFMLVMSIMGALTFFYVRAAHSANLATASKLHSPTHGSSFGGLYNVGQPAGAKAASELLSDERLRGVEVPVSKSVHAVRSLSPQNIINLRGNYVHDEHRSPYASHLYDLPPEKLEAEQKAYVKKMNAVRKEWGAWNFRDPREDEFGPDGRPFTDFAKVEYKDLNIDEFEEGSWQTDGQYVRDFIAEAKKLVDRVKEGIYAEYGYPTKKKDGSVMTDEEKEKRDEMFRLITKDYKLCKGGPVPVDAGFCGRNRETMPGIGYWQDPAFEELAKKLLHAMMTNDEFYAVLGGHSSAAGHGNNFLQSKMMQFHYILEPVFDRLGMRLVSRNMAQGGVGTAMHAMAGGDIYGEADLMFWDSSMTEGDAGAHDLFNRQAILSGERVPVLFMPNMHNIDETDGYKWGGGAIQSSWDDTRSGFIAKTKDEEHLKTLPHAIQRLECENDRRDLCDNDHTYNSVCWVNRSDYKLHPDRKVEKFVGSRAKWHPGHLSHQLAARKWTLIVLYALDKALDTWSNGIEKEGLPLQEKFWHVGKDYEEVREKLRANVGKKDRELSECEKLFDVFPIVCQVAMHGFTEWTPRVLPEERSLRAILKKAPNGYYPFFDDQSEYDGIDVMPPQWKIPEGEVDVHAIAIATTSPPPSLDQSYDAIIGNSRVEDDRRRLRSLPSDEDVTITDEQEESMRRLSAKLEELPINGELTPIRKQWVHGRSLREENEIVTGQGWAYHGSRRPGFCDGSAQSECGRSKTDTCPMSGHNDGRSGFFGDALSGWLVFEVPRVKRGVILMRMEAWHKVDDKNERTEGWTEINNGKTMDTTPFFDTKRDATEEDGDDKPNAKSEDDSKSHHRRLNIPENDFSFDYSINGKVNTLKYKDFEKYKKNIVSNLAVWPIMLDEGMAKKEHSDDYEGETFEVAIRLRSKAGRDATVLISHIYYA